ncbi:CPBP family intramembrane metalloprotease [Butyrivibrio fibrisolvens]|nr:CPBP family intramembrane metalloprotease [Butyrivibrio fibrisolvens]
MNQNNTDRRYIPWIFLPTIFAILIQTAASIIALEFYIVAEMSTYKGDDYTSFMVQVINDYSTGDGTAWTSIIYAAVTASVAFWVYKKYCREGKLSWLTGKSNNLPLTICGILLFSCGMQYVTLYLMNALASSFPSWLEEYEELMESAGISTTMTPLMIVYAIILGPVCEELIFRGITFHAARKAMPVYYAILVQAIMFGAFHMNKLQGIYAFVLGLGLGYIMYLYDSLVITIIIHILFNFIGTIGSEFMPSGGDSILSFFLCTLASLVVSYGAILLLKKTSAVVNNNTESTDI